MKSSQFLALLRGVNVGGNNIVKMADLKGCFVSLGFSDVATYINSGNVIFRTEGTASLAVLAGRIEKTLDRKLKLPIKVVVVTYAELKQAITLVPKGFGSDPARYRYDVIFLKPPLTAKQAVKDIPFKPGVDQVTAGRQVIYFSRLIAKAAQSKLPRVIQLPIYKSMTIRNWNTTTKLLALMQAREQ